ncbi:hypothetical protein [Streptomyces sp. NPDC099088]|uniref:hypothetical protein n=1 Tax=Streptomyces sp. NPDC099088 TaxID=3366101 RepID=UPI0038126D80
MAIQDADGLGSSAGPGGGKGEDSSVDTESAMDAAARQARFGKLPERIGFDQMVQEQAANGPGVAPYNPEASWNQFSCLALDLGL